MPTAERPDLEARLAARGAGRRPAARAAGRRGPPGRRRRPAAPGRHRGGRRRAGLGGAGQPGGQAFRPQRRPGPAARAGPGRERGPAGRRPGPVAAARPGGGPLRDRGHRLDRPGADRLGCADWTGASTPTGPPSTWWPGAGGRCRQRPRPSSAGPAWRGCRVDRLELLIWGGMALDDEAAAGESMRRGDGLAYDPDQRAWRRLRAPPRSLPHRPAPSSGRAGSCWWSTPKAANRRPGAGSPAPPTIPWPTSGGRRRPARAWAAASCWAGPCCGPGRACSSGRSGSGRAVPLPPAPTPTGWRCGPTTRRPTAGRSCPLRPPRSGRRWCGPRSPGPDGGPGGAEHHRDPARPAAVRRALRPRRRPLDADRRPAPACPLGDASALVWTGAALLADGDAAYDPAADRWWPLPAPGGWRWVGAGPPVRLPGGGAAVMLVPEPD